MGSESTVPHLLKLIDHGEEILASLCLASMCVIIGTQVFYRYALADSLVWAEELGRYLFIWAVFVGCSFAAKEHKHLEVTILKHSVREGLQRLISIVALVLTLVFCGFVVVWGIGMVRAIAGTGQETPALEVSAVWVFASLPIGMALMGFRTLQQLIALLRGDELPDDGPSTAL